MIADTFASLREIIFAKTQFHCRIIPRSFYGWKFMFRCYNIVFRYLVHANGICAGYSLLSAIIVAMPRPSTIYRAWTFFFLDQVLLDYSKSSSDSMSRIAKPWNHALWFLKNAT